MRKVIMGTAVAAMLAASSMAQAAPVRAGSPVDAAEAQTTGSEWALIALLIVAVVAFGFAINSSDDDTLPRSP